MKFIPDKPQELIYEHLVRCKKACLWVGMGLGKTASLLWFISHMLKLRELTGVLIVSPVRVTNLTWPFEVKKFTQFRWMKVANLRTERGQRAFLRGDAQIYLINYESMHLLVKLVLKKMRGSGKLPYNMVVWDESTKLKNPAGKMSAIYRRMMDILHERGIRVPRVVAMSGTPIPNNELDLWNQLRMVDGGKRLGRDFTLFQQTYFTPDFRGYKWEANEGAAEKIQKRIADITLTLRSSDWLDIPEMDVQDVDVPMPAAMLKQYRAFEKELITSVEDTEINAINAGVLVTKLLQFTSGAVYDDERVVRSIHDLKIQALKDLHKKHDRVPFLVAYGYTHEEDRLREAFPKARFFSDAKGIRTQTQLLADWNAGKIPILVGHPASMSHGLNMQQGGCNIAWLSLTYNREWYNQLNSRLWRRGQDRITTIWRLMVPETVDWAVASALETKTKRESVTLEALKRLEAFIKKGGVIDEDLDEETEIQDKPRRRSLF